MNKKIFIISILVISIIILSGCTSNTAQTNDTKTNINKNKPAEKIQVFYFHATQRCFSCITLEKFSKETVEEYFQPELESGKIEFREINIDLPENKELANKFQASGSALFINTIIDGKDNIQEEVTVWRLIGNENQFKIYLKGKLNNLLGK
ncbi:MAG: nitrophenyl compound nitroreductase subunit ArsF family protein [Patescibacteria group bacterium]|nr:nitrophenyl compound nitroreductase subunit ArsF family protein [Patescibacteria group bacterium]